MPDTTPPPPGMEWVPGHWGRSGWVSMDTGRLCRLLALELFRYQDAGRGRSGWQATGKARYRRANSGSRDRVDGMAVGLQDIGGKGPE